MERVQRAGRAAVQYVWDNIDRDRLEQRITKVFLGTAALVEGASAGSCIVTGNFPGAIWNGTEMVVCIYLCINVEDLDLVREMRRLAGRLEEVHAQIVEVNQQREALVVDHRREVGRLEAAIVELREANQELREAKLELEETNRELEARIAEMERVQGNIDQVQQRRVELQEAHDREVRALEDVEDNIEEMRALLDGYEARKVQLLQEIREETGKKDKLRCAVYGLLERQRTVSEQIDETTERLRLVTERLENLKNELENPRNEEEEE